MKPCYSDRQQNSCPRELESYRSICFIKRLTGQQIETLKVERTCFRVTPPSLRQIRNIKMKPMLFYSIMRKIANLKKPMVVTASGPIFENVYLKTIMTFLEKTQTQ